jgi:phosphinothricin acetyltransferase
LRIVRREEQEMADLSVRPATLGDLERLTAIYNHYVGEGAITFDIDPFTPEERRSWYAAHTTGAGHRLLVAEDGGGLLGYAGTGPFRAKRAYDTTVETTIYIVPDACGRGVGHALYAALFAALEGEDVHRAVAGVTLPNPASIALHRRFGFREVGVFRENGRKHGRYWDVMWLEKDLGAFTARRGP